MTRSKLRVGCKFALAGWLVWGLQPAESATILVPSEYSTIQAGIDASNAGDTVLVAPGTYSDVQTRVLQGGSQWTACVFLKDGVVVASTGGPNVTTIDMLGEIGPQPKMIIGRYLTSGTTELSGFTVTGSAVGVGGAYFAFSENITIRHCIFRDLDNHPSGGGGIVTNNDATVIDCRFENCRADGGGAIASYLGHLRLFDSEFISCDTPAVLVLGDIPPYASATVVGCRFIDNEGNDGSSEGKPGGVSIGSQSGIIEIRDCLFQGNRGQGPGSGGVNAEGSLGTEVIVEGCTFIDNHAPLGQGGGIKVRTLSSPPAEIRNNSFLNNSSFGLGNAVSLNCTGGGAALSNNIIAGSSGEYGAVYASSSTPVVSSCNVFWDNESGPGDFFTLGSTDRIVDPRFCDPETNDVRLQSDSPCLPSDPSGCGLVGAIDETCGTVSVERTSWGLIKARYRGGKIE